MVFIDPVTRQRFTRMRHSGDMTYDLDINTGSEIAMETVPVIGAWEDFTGSDTTLKTKQIMFFAGVENELHGTDAQVEGGQDLNDLGIVGQPTGHTRRRLIKRRVNFEDGRIKSFS